MGRRKAVSFYRVTDLGDARSADAVIETDDGVYELIDGLQRISSYLHFRGEQLGETENERLVLQGCDIVGDLNGLMFDDLPKALQIKIKRSFVRMEVIKKGVKLPEIPYVQTIEHGWRNLVGAGDPKLYDQITRF